MTENKIPKAGVAIQNTPVQDIYIFRVQDGLQSLLMVAGGIVFMAIAFGIWSVNLSEPGKISESDRILAWGLTLFFFLLGFLFISFRSQVVVKPASRTVTQVKRLWLILFIWRWKRTWTFSAFDRVGVRVRDVTAKGITTHVALVYLVTKRDGKEVVVLSKKISGYDLPPEVQERANQLATLLSLEIRAE